MGGQVSEKSGFNGVLMKDMISFSSRKKDSPIVKKLIQTDLKRTEFAKTHPKYLPLLEEEFSRTSPAHLVLDDREKAFIMLHYGIIDGEFISDRKIAAEKLDLSTVNYMKKGALRKIRNKTLINQLENYREELKVPKKLRYLLKMENTYFQEYYGEKEFKKLRKAFDNLEALEKVFVILYYGIQDNNPQTQVKAGALIKLYSKGINLEKSAFEKIKDKNLIEKIKTLKVPENARYILSSKHTYFAAEHGKAELKCLKDTFKRLEALERVVLTLYYGTENGESKTLRAVSKMLHIPEMVIKNIKKDSLEKINNKKLIDKLEELKIPKDLRYLLKMENTYFEEKIGKNDFDNFLKSFERLDVSERTVIILHYGLHNIRPRSYDGTSKMLNIPGITMKRLKQSALGKLENKWVEQLENYREKIIGIPPELRHLLDFEFTAFEEKYGKNALNELKQSAEPLKPIDKVIFALTTGLDGKFHTKKAAGEALGRIRHTIKEHSRRLLKKIPQNIKDTLSEFSYSVKYNSPEEISELVNQHYKRAFKQGAGIAREFHFAGDYTEIVDNALYTAARNFKNKGDNFEAYLYSYIRYGFIAHFAYAGKPLSLDKTFSNSEGTLMDIIPDKKSMTPQENIYVKEMSQIVDYLPDDIRNVIKLKFGFEEEALENQEIAKRLNINEKTVDEALHEGFTLLKKMVKSF